MPTQTNDRASAPGQNLLRRHLLAGWIGLLTYLILGIVLETLHGLKTNSYLDPNNSTRRLMWTLAHAHGTLFALVNIVFALTIGHLQFRQSKSLTLASRCLMAGLIVLPLGFFAGGCWLYGGDPGLGIFLVPPGAALMLAGVAAVVVSLFKNHTRSDAGNSQSSADVHRPVINPGSSASVKDQKNKKRRDS